eukprot:Anaeramoba_ignava/c20276_g1_i1.p5 GENE.c20276_g1_i1~~c20276_g1_i1.p5  ORF type:complete len:106 (-),score=9.33 c20276_g1_i1:1070-1387(-)
MFGPYRLKPFFSLVQNLDITGLRMSHFFSPIFIHFFASLYLLFANFFILRIFCLSGISFDFSFSLFFSDSGNFTSSNGLGKTSSGSSSSFAMVSGNSVDSDFSSF